MSKCGLSRLRFDYSPWLQRFLDGGRKGRQGRKQKEGSKAPSASVHDVAKEEEDFDQG
jgi:hypothetical protein